ncbi:cytochrome P450 [Streptomyces fuscichromogenes]|uniref:cytochrome P450 n=1 Tax=Streptomyces fuscichromogenes TaxID=1324013 RepID=UPI003828753A
MAVNDGLSGAQAGAGTQGDERPLQEVVFQEPDFFRDPYPAYARLRSEAPVWWCEEQSAWLVSRYEDVRAVLLDAQTYSNRPHQGLYGPYDDDNAGSFFLKDQPEHTAWRRIFTGGGGFSAAAMKACRDVMEEICADLIAKLPAGDIDAVRDISVPLTAGFLARLYDLPADDAPWVEAITDFYHPGTAELTPTLLAYFEDLVKKRREAPGHDPLSKAVLANDSKGPLLTDQQMAWNFHDLVLAGAASMYAAIAESVAVLAENPETQDSRHWESSEAAERSTEEILRWLEHSHWLFRTATVDVELGGRRIRAGDGVFPLIASANRDDDVWGNGSELDLGRNAGVPNLAFGYGPHIAVGAMVARAFLATMLPILVRARAPFRLGGVPERVLGNGVSTPTTIPITPADES